MRIHLNINKPGQALGDVSRALAAARDAGLVAPQVRLDQCTLHGSRSHALAVEVSLRAGFKVKGDKRRRPNSGQYGSRDEWAATYDEWGHFLVNVFATDPTAKAGPYDGVEDFDMKTRYAYDATVPV